MNFEVIGEIFDIQTITNNTFAICINNSSYPASLEKNKVYRILPDEDAKEDGDLRIVDESGEDYLYPADYFIVVTIPGATARALETSLTYA